MSCKIDTMNWKVRNIRATNNARDLNIVEQPILSSNKYGFWPAFTCILNLSLVI